jgi:hypothetical protein
MRRMRVGSRPLRLWAVMQLSGLVPEVMTYNAAVSAYEKGAHWQQVMQLSGLVLDVATYNAAVSAHEKGAQWQ